MALGAAGGAAGIVSSVVYPSGILTPLTATASLEMRDNANGNLGGDEDTCVVLLGQGTLGLRGHDTLNEDDDPVLLAVVGSSMVSSYGYKGSPEPPPRATVAMPPTSPEVIPSTENAIRWISGSSVTSVTPSAATAGDGVAHIAEVEMGAGGVIRLASRMASGFGPSQWCQDSPAPIGVDVRSLLLRLSDDQYLHRKTVWSLSSFSVTLMVYEALQA